MEKEAYSVNPTEKYSNESPPYGHDDPTRIVEEKGIRLGEAADMYGDLGSAEEYGYVTRGYVKHQIRLKKCGH